ncbi:DUF3263 domain-containing protein [Cellulomonas sp. ACRRI]|uniref:DUF3263 domain-containing protein n=1 Tax=Cellulomonas sp. ACRRI TaxID=2918188 RepID=UPI001EF2AD76|nr:DUF3263 domain-containing protein [Cellulomonas sp. ACRRI]MCG7285401.1 DUF3263 domain-containing protein [Cellulomonas sp. ACRRI]
MLSDRDRAILDTESRFWRHAGAKEDYVRDRLGLTPLAYYQCVNALLGRGEAWEYAPATCARLDRLRRGRRAPAGGRRLAG